jgi:predicted outer membrane protein
MMPSFVEKLALAACVLPFSAGCARTDLSPASGASFDAGPPAEAGAPADGAAVDGGVCSPVGEALAQCTSDSVVAIAQAVDTAEVALAQTVRAGTTNPSVTAYAEKMITDHSLLLEELGGAMRAGANVATSNEIGRTVARTSEAAIQTLTTDASGIDREYLSYDLLFHLQSLALLERLTGPSAQGASSLLRFAIDNMRDTEEKHVRLAITVSAALEGTCGGDDANANQ